MNCLNFAFILLDQYSFLEQGIRWSQAQKYKIACQVLPLIGEVKI